MLHENLDAAHQHVWTNHQKILKNPQNGSFNGILSSILTDGTQMKLMKQKFRQWWNSNIYLSELVALIG